VNNARIFRASTTPTLHSVWENDPSVVRRHSPVTTETTQQQQQLLEMLKQKAQEQVRTAKL